MRAIPAFREPGPRLELMDELGLDRTLMFPTLASLVEERLRDDPVAIHAVIHALNEWLYETWDFNYEDRIFTTPVITLPIVEKAIEELEWVVERGAKAVLIRPAPVPGFRGPRSFALPEFDPFWEKVRRARHPRRDALLATAATPATPPSGTAPPRRCCRSSPTPFRMLNEWRPIEDAVASLGDPRRAVPLPDAEGRGHRERARSGWSRCSTAWPTSTRRCREDFPGNPIEVIKRNIYVSPFCEEDLDDLIDLIGVDHVLFGSDYPHPEGLAEPTHYVDRARASLVEDQAKIMGGNLARLVTV